MEPDLQFTVIINIIRVLKGKKKPHQLIDSVPWEIHSHSFGLPQVNALVPKRIIFSHQEGNIYTNSAFNPLVSLCRFKSETCT